VLTSLEHLQVMPNMKNPLRRHANIFQTEKNLNVLEQLQKSEKNFACLSHQASQTAILIPSISIIARILRNSRVNEKNEHKAVDVWERKLSRHGSTADTRKKQTRNSHAWWELPTPKYPQPEKHNIPRHHC
jgi:hypothetical protein